MIPSAQDIIEAFNDYRVKFLPLEDSEGYELVITKKVED